MREIAQICLVVAGMVVAAGCSQTEKKKNTGAVDIYEALDDRTRIRLRQYFSQGAQLYKLHCANCHQSKGQGLAALIPPLAAADYLLADPQRAACIVRHGQKGKIMVNGVEYTGIMPGLELKDLEIAEIVTYISNSWGNKQGLIDVKSVSKYLKSCPEQSI